MTPEFARAIELASAAHQHGITLPDVARRDLPVARPGQPDAHGIPGRDAEIPDEHEAEHEKAHH